MIYPGQNRIQYIQYLDNIGRINSHKVRTKSSTISINDFLEIRHWGLGAALETSFGNWVRRRRKGLDLTQEELAKRVGCSASLIFKIETDERRPSRQIAALLAEQLQIPLDQRDLFLKVARQELAAFRLGTATEPFDLQASAVAPMPDFTGASRSGRGSLPVMPTPFIGREHEIDIVVQQILDPACRLLTLTGPGGVGKTRLAVEVARRLESSFTDGIFFLAMAGVEQPESIVPVIADSIGLVFSGPADPMIQLVQALRKQKLLLVLDNMEHLIAGSSVLGDLLQEIPGLRMLLTSREPVHLQWEWIFEVQGLPIPASTLPEVIEANSAAALFLQRTRQAAQHISLQAAQGSTGPAALNTELAVVLNPGNTLHEPAQDAEAIVQICKLVDGLPLAIELAASWARVMSPAEIAEELAHGLDLLQTTLQDIPARHRSIQLVFDHSWKLLTEEERAALMKLAVFQGGFTREAAQKAAGVSVMLLSALVSKSLLRFGKTAGRYDFHELVRQYAQKHLSQNPDLEQSAYARHAEFYANWLADLEWQIKSAQQIEASTRIRAEKPNWSTAWNWTARHQRLDLLRKMAPCLYWYFEIHGDNVEAVTSIGYAIHELKAAGAPESLTNDTNKAAFILLVDQLGWFEFRMGNVERAEVLFTESQTLAASLAEPDNEVFFYININWGYMTLVTGDLETSWRSTQLSLENGRALGGQWYTAIAISILGIVEYQRGNLEEAYLQLSDSLKLWREVGDLRGLVFCMLYLGSAAFALGKYETVEEIVRESNAIAQQKQDHWALAFGQDLLGNVAFSQGDYATAAAYYQHSLSISQEIGNQLAATQSLIQIGDAQLGLGNSAEARRLFAKAYENARQAHWLSTMMDALTASLAADGTSPEEIRLAIALAVLDNPVVTLPTRQRAERLKNQLEKSLHPQKVEAAQVLSREKSAEQWASAFFTRLSVENASTAAPAWDGSIKPTPP